MGKNRFGQVLCLTAFVLLTLASTLAADNVYWAGGDLHVANLEGSGAIPFWGNVCSGDVAVDPSHGRSTGPTARPASPRGTFRRE